MVFHKDQLCRCAQQKFLLKWRFLIKSWQTSRGRLLADMRILRCQRDGSKNNSDGVDYLGSMREPEHLMPKQPSNVLHFLLILHPV